MKIRSVPIESFFDQEELTELWPAKISSNHALRMQVGLRKELIKCLDNASKILPSLNTPLSCIIEKRTILEDIAIRIYDDLTLLLQDHANRRLILYLPLELLPDRKKHSFRKELSRALDRFEQSYMEAWKDMLFIEDIRANFIDGNNAIEYYYNMPRVVKAAHLIPKFIENGLIDMDDAIALTDHDDSQVLRDSIIDAFCALGSEDDTGRTYKENQRSLNEIMENLVKINNQIENDDYEGFSKEEIRNIKKSKKKDVIESSGEYISRIIIGKKILPKEMIRFASENLLFNQVLIEGIMIAIMKSGKINGFDVYEKYYNYLLSLWMNDKGHLRETLSKAYRHLCSLSVIDEERLAELGITIPALGGPFSKNLQHLTHEVTSIEKAIDIINSNKLISRFLYPVIMLFGSQFKGYGSDDSGIEIGIMIKPGISFGNRHIIEAIVKHILPTNQTNYKVTEFWLEKNSGLLQINDIHNNGISLGQSYWAHVLFGSVWIGEKETIKYLFEKLLTDYLCNEKKMLHGLSARSLCLEELERDTLQNGLMNGGYEKFFPRSSPKLHDRIDGKSIFWDSGYRYLAMKLFISRVFLPIIRPETTVKKS
ncbi:MAG: hypothetical protein PHW52_01540 [Candidatus Pacebacteria bacterium]|nr:hypothetical protein [Candidatus Paceibacterota bacterium]